MKKRFFVPVLALCVGMGATAAPAVADGAASTRNILLGSLAAIGAAIGINHQQHREQTEKAAQETQRRQESYKAYFYEKYGYYPTPDEVDAWYHQTYGVEPS